MYVDESTVTSSSGKKHTRYLLRESYREQGKVKKRTLANISNCPLEEIQILKQALGKGKRGKPKKNNNNSNVVLVDLNKIEEQPGKRWGAMLVLNEIAHRLGLHQVLGTARNALLILWLIFARIMEQGSRLKAVRMAQFIAVDEVLGLTNFDEDDLYQAMDWLEENHHHIEDDLMDVGAGNNPDKEYGQLLLYDVTSSYVEGDQNELAEFGYDRDGKKGKKIIVVGLLTDENGEPLCIEAFPGNTQDPASCSERIKAIKQRFGVDKLTLVGDRGMIKSKQIEQIEANDGWNYITAITKPQINKMLKDGIFQMSLFDEVVQEIVVDDVRYVFRRNPVRAQEIRATRESKLSKLRQTMFDRQQYLDDHPRAKESVALRLLTEKANNLKIGKLVSFKSIDRRLTMTGDKTSDEWQEAEKLDGCYVIKTNIVDTKILTAQQVHDRYKDLAFVEQAFRNMKTVILEQRPVYVRKKERTQAHVFITMLAFKIVRYLIQAFKDYHNEVLNLMFDSEKPSKNQVLEFYDILSELDLIENNELIIEGISCKVTKRLRPAAQKILDVLNIKLPVPQIDTIRQGWTL